MKVAVTGISGYLGRVLLPHLEDDPEIDKVIGIDLAETTSKKMEFVRRDVRDKAIEKDLEGCDALVHLAFIVMPLRSEKEMDSINIEGSKNVFEAAARAGVKNVVYTSSVASYGGWTDNPPLIKEDWHKRPMPSFYYSRTKAAIENWLDGFESENPSMRIVRLRPCIFLGPKINNLMREVNSSKAMINFRGVDAKVQFVWDEDIARAIILSLRKDVRGGFNLAGDGYLTPRDMADELGKKTVTLPFGMAMGIVKVLWRLGVTKQLHPGWLEVARYPIIVDTARAREELGWEPTYSSAEALRAFVKSLE